MDTILLWGALAIFCALLESIGLWRYGLAVGFFITTTLLAIHYDFGTDYWSYYDWYHDSIAIPKPNSISEFIEMSRDPGWDFINIIFYKIFGSYGFFCMVGFLSIIEGICYYIFIRRSVSHRWYWLAMATYVLNHHFFILTFSMMRQSLAMALLLICFIGIQQRKIILPTLIILLASAVHNSILLCFPLIFIPYIIGNNQRLIAIIISTAWLVFLLSSSILEPILNHFASLTGAFSRYVEVYRDTSTMTFGIGYILKLIPFLYFLYTLFKNQFPANHLSIATIWALTLILTPFGTIIPMFGRLLFYFDLASLAVLPLLFSVSKSRIIQFVLVLSSLLVITVATYTSFYDPISPYYRPFLTFHTIFSIK